VGVVDRDIGERPDFFDHLHRLPPGPNAIPAGRSAWTGNENSAAGVNRCDCAIRVDKALAGFPVERCRITFIPSTRNHSARQCKQAAQISFICPPRLRDWKASRYRPAATVPNSLTACRRNRQEAILFHRRDNRAASALPGCPPHSIDRRDCGDVPHGPQRPLWFPASRKHTENRPRACRLSGRDFVSVVDRHAGQIGVSAITGLLGANPRGPLIAGYLPEACRSLGGPTARFYKSGTCTVRDHRSPR